MPIPFTKMHVSGNDFVVLDGVRQSFHVTSKLVQQMSDRHFGIGFDQLLLLESPKKPAADFEYRIFNRDGNEVAQCGNGALCVGKFLLETGLTSFIHKKIILSTKARNLEVHLSTDNQIAVNMGVPLLDPKQIPFNTPHENVFYDLKLDNHTFFISAVNMGNPHVVLLTEDIHKTPVKALGKKIASHPAFPESVNVGFMQIIHRNQIRLRVYERGAGETLACGSGACAAVVVGQLRGLLDAEVNVLLPGGQLNVCRLSRKNPVWLSGLASTVFKGVWP